MQGACNQCFKKKENIWEGEVLSQIIRRNFNKMKVTGGLYLKKILSPDLTYRAWKDINDNNNTIMHGSSSVIIIINKNLIK